MKKKLIYSHQWAKDIRTPAKASEFISHLEQVKLGLAVIYVRVSSRTQMHNLQHQISTLRRELEKRGFSVIEVVQEIASGWLDSRIGFFRAITKAKAADAVVVALSVDRFRRAYRYHPSDKILPLNVIEVEELMSEAAGVQLATLIHPDTPPEQVRSEQTKRGQVATGRYGGRPKETKKERRVRLLPVVLKLRKSGWSYRKIGRKVKVHWGTVRDWISQRGE
jgi:DNA invertase Pin-like site-specific DNA recombinase